MSIVDVLRQVPFYSQLPTEQLEAFAHLGKVTTVAAGDHFCRQGDQADTMVVVLSGSLRIYLHHEDDDEITLQECSVGDYFGELALLDDQPRSASVRALSDCTLFTLSRAAFRQLLTTNPTVLFGVLTGLTQRIRHRTEEYYQSQLGQQMIKREAELARHRALAQMVAGVAHEINTPIGVANTAADMIEKRLRLPLLTALVKDNVELYSVVEELTEAATLLKKNLLRAHKLVQNFKNVSVNQLTDVLETVALPTLVQDVVDLFQINARQANLTITIENRLTAETAWYGYPGYFTQVLLNLLTNIERYAYAAGQGGPVAIVLSTTELANKPAFKVLVRDYGKGIAAQDLPHIFEPFFTTGRALGGTGLGMAIVNNLVTEALGGTITIESAPAQETTVTVTIPVKIAGSDPQTESRGLHG